MNCLPWHADIFPLYRLDFVMRTEGIFIEGLAIPASIGVFDWEKTVRQTLIFDLDIECRFGKAGTSDTLGDTINYADVCDEIRLIVDDRHYNLLESLAMEIEQMLQSKFPVIAYRLKIRKPGAIPDATAVGVTMSCVFESSDREGRA